MPSVPPREFIIDVTGLAIERDGTTILRDVAWQVAPGEHWVILGANGSGKTSLLNALLSYLPATRGSVSVLGRRYGKSDWRELRKRVGVVSTAVPQMMPPGEPGLNVIYSGRDAMIGAWGAVEKSEVARAEELLARVECTHLERRPWRVLSQGERQRLLIGRALMAQPRLLILDEPCAGLDPGAREHFLEFVDDLGHALDAPTLVLVTHHVEEITAVYTHVLVLKQGRILAHGDKSATLTSAVLSEAFGESATLRCAEDRYTLSFARDAGRVV